MAALRFMVTLRSVPNWEAPARYAGPVAAISALAPALFALGLAARKRQNVAFART